MNRSEEGLSLEGAQEACGEQVTPDAGRNGTATEAPEMESIDSERPTVNDFEFLEPADWQLAAPPWKPSFEFALADGDEVREG